MSKKLDTKKLFGEPQAQAPRAGDLRAIEALSDVKQERIYYVGPAKYARGIKELKNMSAESVALKDFIEEAFDDLFRKYQAGEGRFKVTDLEEVGRRISNLPK
jgi:hypothetical protein